MWARKSRISTDGHGLTQSMYQAGSNAQTEKPRGGMPFYMIIE
ncbi:MAG: hypothetical protein VYE01_06500 [Pseudomonadota bacterium]|nr:hypothetical protein [Pseudomonadota bacterium]